MDATARSKNHGRTKRGRLAALALQIPFATPYTMAAFGQHAEGEGGLTQGSSGHWQRFRHQHASDASAALVVHSGPTLHRRWQGSASCATDSPQACAEALRNARAHASHAPWRGVVTSAHARTGLAATVAADALPSVAPYWRLGLRPLEPPCQGQQWTGHTSEARRGQLAEERGRRRQLQACGAEDAAAATACGYCWLCWHPRWMKRIDIVLCS